MSHCIQSTASSTSLFHAYKQTHHLAVVNNIMPVIIIIDDERVGVFALTLLKPRTPRTAADKSASTSAQSGDKSPQSKAALGKPAGTDLVRRHLGYLMG